MVADGAHSLLSDAMPCYYGLGIDDYNPSTTTSQEGGAVPEARQIRMPRSGGCT